MIDDAEKMANKQEEALKASADKDDKENSKDNKDNKENKNEAAANEINKEIEEMVIKES